MLPGILAVPVDGSAMSIDSLEQVLDAMRQVDSIQWCIVRTMVNRRATSVRKQNEDFLNAVMSSGSNGLRSADDSPIYLLNSYVPRTEAQNKLTFQRKTAFDVGGVPALRASYNGVAGEVMRLLKAAGKKEEKSAWVEDEDFMSTSITSLVEHPLN